MRSKLFIIVLLANFFLTYGQEATNVKKTICILGGTPSSAKIINEIPEDLKERFHFISLNRPGYGGTANETWNKKRLFELASKAGLKKNDFAVIGVSGGGPLAILIAKEFGLKYCGVISGMVPAKEYFAHADSTFTKSLMISALGDYKGFKKVVESFPNVEEILKQAESPLPTAIRACYDDLHFILSDIRYKKNTFSDRNLTWIHGENDKNVAFESAQLFLSKFKKATLIKLPNTNHAVDASQMVRQLIEQWTSFID